MKNRYDKNILPLSMLCDLEGCELWHIEGKQDLKMVLRKFEEFIDSPGEFIDASLKILPKTS